MENEIELKTKTSTEIIETNEIERSNETLDISPRVVIYGQMSPFYGGAIELKDALKTYLGDHGMSDERVIFSRVAGNINEAFYKGRRKAESVEAAVMPLTKREKIRNLLGSISLRLSGKESTSITETTSDNMPAVIEDTLPTAVFVFPKMRHYSENGQGMTVDTPVEYIKRLCSEHDVPMVMIDENTTQSELVSSIGELPQPASIELE
ncbi:hypothetical protein CVV43_00070 [Candidatus Saccharibacteria bacterium HGW-Saccharibacteria-1]|jgi:hypothetical protein|nr:MAG: hypothetical protein CVV43_00070 [Candidatus Saccharibacteria bacterium HGW-Saccharibacteria-1]